MFFFLGFVQKAKEERRVKFHYDLKASVSSTPKPQRHTFRFCNEFQQIIRIYQITCVWHSIGKHTNILKKKILFFLNESQSKGACFIFVFCVDFKVQSKTTALGFNGPPQKAFLIFFFEKGFHVAKVGPQLNMQLRMTLIF